MRPPDGPLLVVAPHPDDEVLGCGGLIAAATDSGREVHVVIVTKAGPPLFDEADLARSRREAAAAHDVLGVTQTHLLDFPAAGLDQVRHGDLNAALGRVLADAAAATVLVPFGGDLHLDHQAVFRSSMVATRPARPGAPRTVLAYETLSETNWRAPGVVPPFDPNLYVDISDHLDRKLDAMRCYASQLHEPPHERSIESLRALGELRGATVGLAAAEAFMVIRAIR